MSGILITLVLTLGGHLHQCEFLTGFNPEIGSPFFSKKLEVARYDWDNTNILAYRATHKASRPNLYTYLDHQLIDLYVRLDKEEAIQRIHFSLVPSKDFIDLFTEQYGQYDRVMETDFDLEIDSLLDTRLNKIYIWTREDCRIKIETNLVEYSNPAGKSVVRIWMEFA